MKNFSILVAVGGMCLATPGQADLYVRSNRTSTLSGLYALKNPVGKAASNSAFRQINDLGNLAINPTQDAVNGLYISAGMEVSVIQSPGMLYFTKYEGTATYILYKAVSLGNSNGMSCALTTFITSANVDTMGTTTTDGYSVTYGNAYKIYTGTDPDELNIGALTGTSLSFIGNGTGKVALARRGTHNVGMSGILDLVNMCVYNYTRSASSSITPVAGYDSNC